MSVFDKYTKQVEAEFSDWVKIEDNKCPYTIEDFSYKTGVDETITKPHCYKCVTVNKCWFKNNIDKLPVEEDYSKYNNSSLNVIKGLYHYNCHCKKAGINQPKSEDVKFLIAPGKVIWAFTDKGHTLNAMGYREGDFNDSIEIIKQLVANEYIEGNYIPRVHDKMGYKIGFVLKNFPGKNEKAGKFYKVKTGWTIFPNGKLKCNTLIGGLKK